MNFLEATNADILKVSRKDQFEELLAAIETLSDYGYDFDEFSENKTVELILAGENLSLDDIEEFAKTFNNVGEGRPVCTSERFLNWGFEKKLLNSRGLNFQEFKQECLDNGLIHQLQYDNYKYIGKHA